MWPTWLMSCIASIVTLRITLSRGLLIRCLLDNKIGENWQNRKKVSSTTSSHFMVELPISFLDFYRLYFLPVFYFRVVLTIQTYWATNNPPPYYGLLYTSISLTCGFIMSFLLWNSNVVITTKLKSRRTTTSSGNNFSITALQIIIRQASWDSLVLKRKYWSYLWIESKIQAAALKVKSQANLSARECCTFYEKETTRHLHLIGIHT